MAITFAVLRDRLEAARVRGEPFGGVGAELPTHGPARDARGAGGDAPGLAPAYANEPATQPERALGLVGHRFTEGDVKREAPRVVGVKVG